MPRKTPISREDVRAAADALAERGLRITMRAIRSELGDTGSMGTIQPWYAEWMADHGRVPRTRAKPAGSLAHWSSEVQRLGVELRKATFELVRAAEKTSK